MGPDRKIYSYNFKKLWFGLCSDRQKGSDRGRDTLPAPKYGEGKTIAIRTVVCENCGWIDREGDMEEKKICGVCKNQYCSFPNSEGRFLRIQYKGYQEAYAYPSDFADGGMIIYRRSPRSGMWYSTSDLGNHWRKIGKAQPGRREIVNHLEYVRENINNGRGAKRIRKRKKKEK